MRIRKGWIISLCVLQAMTSCMSMQPPPPPSVLSGELQPKVQSERLILVTLPMAPMPQLMQTAKELSRDYQLENRAAWKLKTIAVHCVVYEVAGNRSRQRAIEQLTSDPRIDSAQPMQLFRVLGEAYNDPYLHLQQNLIMINTQQVRQTATGRGIKIAVIDTGVDVQHPDLQSQIIGTKNFVDPQEHPMRGEYHGTAVAGVMAASADNGIGIAGVAPGSQLLALKACWENPGTDTGLCSSFTLAQAIDFAIEQNSHILNMSLTGPSDPLLERLITMANQKNVTVIAARSAEKQSVEFPASMKTVIAVRATSLTDSLQKVSGKDLDEMVLAPGTEILTTTPRGTYDFVSGSSFAAAHVSGIVAILLQHQPNLMPSQIHTYLLESSHPTMSGQHNEVPVVNVCMALAKLDKQLTCREENSPKPAIKQSETSS